MTFRPVYAVVLAALLILCPQPSEAQEPGGDMSVEAYEPTTSLVVPENVVTRARYPFVDVHSHWFRAPGMSPGAIDTLVAEMDGLNMAVAVNLSGGKGERLANSVSNMEGRHPSRFVTFANVDFSGVGEEGWAEEAVAQLRSDAAAGARGLKIYKNLGMDAKDTDGNRIAVDDPRLDPIWALCGELRIPVLIHSADPANFWKPRDQFNEKWLELKLRPNRFRPADRYPSFEQIIGEQHQLFRNHPQTTFISAHLSWLGHDLGRLEELLDELPNMYSEVGAVLYELGRQPRAARAFLEQYHDRILFGKDAYAVTEYHAYFRTFETADEYFDYYRKYHAQWKLYGMDLPDAVLRDLYYGNALRIIPGLDRSLFP